MPATTPPHPATIELLMVRSARWGHWSWPKGKLEPGEPACVAAVREVAEETGVRPRLGLPLPGLRYRTADGQRKQVDLWVGRVDAARVHEPSAGEDEIAERAWVTPPEALARLQWPSEAAPATQVLRLAALGRLSTTALLVVRHAKARKRSAWPGPEAARPLTAVGLQQASGLGALLDCWAPDTLISSPWQRCLGTVQPYAQSRGLQPLLEPLLTEDAAAADPAAVAALMRRLVADGADAALCTHRPVLAAVVAGLAAAAGTRAGARLPRADPWLHPAETLVAHLAAGGGEVVALERHRPPRLPAVLQPVSQ